jgi:Ca2+:H+ antiporter
LSQPPGGLPYSSWIFPLCAAALFAVAQVTESDGSFGRTPVGVALAIALIPILFGTVYAAVHHAEVIAHRTGEPYGTLVLTLAVTVIEVALIVSIMLAGGSGPTVVRDTVFAVIMIVCNGLVGLCIFVGGLRYREQDFQVSGASAYLTVLIALVTLTLVLPAYTTTLPGPVYTESQLMFASVATIALYLVFLYIQTVRHQDYFLTLTAGPHGEDASGLPSGRAVAISGVLLLVSLAVVILLAKKFAAVVDVGLSHVGAPNAVAGVVVAILILMPESVAALRAARRNELQKSLNLALGSSLATIGLTVPAVAAVNIALEHAIVLGLEDSHVVLLAITVIVSLLTFGTGRTNVLFGFVHLVIFATFVFFVFVP